MQIQQTERVFRYSKGLCCQIQTPRLESRGPAGVRLIVSGNYHGRGERSGICGRKTGLHVQNGSGHKILRTSLACSDC